MNKNILKYAGIFAAGAAVGSGITYIVVKRAFEKIAEKEIEEAREFFNKEWSHIIHKELPESTEEEENDEVVVGFDVCRNVNSDDGDSIDYAHYYVKKNIFDEYDPSEFESPSEKDIEEPSGEETGEQLTKDASKIDDLIIRITPESFAYDFPQYDKQTLFYYILDETLVTEDEEMIDDVSRIIGNCILDDSMDTVYIRNGKMGTDYEIEKVNGSFR